MTIELRRRLLALATVMFLLSACSINPLKGGSESKASNPSGNSSSKGSAFSPSSDASKDVREAIARLNTAYPYRLTETVSASGNSQTAMPDGTRVVEFAAADRSHMKWTGGPGGNIEAISIGDKHYWFSNGKWTAGTVPSMLGYRGEDFANKLADMVKEVKYVGPETVNGMSCYAYTGTFETMMAGQKWSGTAKLWIGADDGLIHQGDTALNAANYGGKSHTVYEYNVNIKVEPPI